MKFHSTSLEGVWRIELEPRQDERGYLARTYCETEFAQHGLNTRWVQCNTTLTRRRGMIRGMHFQADPRPEIKLIRCIAGRVHDVIVDVRRNSPTFGRWEAFTLDEERQDQLYVPGGYAHGFQCLTDDCRLFYQMSDFYVPELARGLLWKDSDINIHWPVTDIQVSERDARLPVLSALQ